MEGHHKENTRTGKRKATVEMGKREGRKKAAFRKSKIDKEKIVR